MSNPLLAYRLQRNLSQAEVAQILGVSRAMVGFLETGQRDYTAEMAVKVERLLGIDRVLTRPDLFRRRAA